MSERYRPVAGTGYPRVVRPNSVRYVNPINELNRLLSRIEQLEATIERAKTLPDQWWKKCDCKHCMGRADDLKAALEEEDE